MRLIDADALVENIRRVLGGTEDLEVIVGAAFFITSSELAPTLTLDDIRPKGRWVTQDESHTRFMCSVCGSKNHDTAWEFCCKCGADMRGDAP